MSNSIYTKAIWARNFGDLSWKLKTIQAGQCIGYHRRRLQASGALRTKEENDVFLLVQRLYQQGLLIPVQRRFEGQLEFYALGISSDTNKRLEGIEVILQVRLEPVLQRLQERRNAS